MRASFGHKVDVNPTAGLVCACGKPTDLICFFGDGESHGVCEKCATVRQIRLETGQTVYRLVCKRCWQARQRG